MVYNKPEPIENLITWVYEEGSFIPSAKIIGEEKFSIINDYIGRPVHVYSEVGELVWETDYDIYGGLREFKGDREFLPFRQLGQYEDVETGLYYNRFRYYNPETGVYISQDPIGLAGNNPNFYAYTYDSNTQVDPFGLDCDVKGTATIRQYHNGHSEGHFTIEIKTKNGSSLTTHQVTNREMKMSRIISNTDGLGKAPYELANTKVIELSNAKAAMTHQKDLMKVSDLGKYDVLNNSCLSHVTDVLEKGGEAAVSKTELGYYRFVEKIGFNRL